MKKIIEDNKNFVRGIIRKMTGSYNEDLEQEVYIKTWKNMPEYAQQGKFRQWLGVLTANLCRDYFRTKRFKVAKVEETDEKVAEVNADCIAPEDVIDAKKRQILILTAVNNLPKAHREVVILYEFEGCSLEVVAQRLKIPVGTVKSRLHNARKILKENLSFLKGENI